MEKEHKLKKLLTTSRDPRETQEWIFSLTPIGVAFAFYMIFIVTSDIEPKGLLMACGAAAGFVGLETYWIIRGWRKNHASTVVMGFIGIAIAISLLFLYMSIG